MRRYSLAPYSPFGALYYPPVTARDIRNAKASLQGLWYFYDMFGRLPEGMIDYVDEDYDSDTELLALLGKRIEQTVEADESERILVPRMSRLSSKALKPLIK